MPERQAEHHYSDLQIVRRLLSESRPYAHYIGGVMALQLLATPLTLLMPVPLKIAVDSVIGSEPLPEFIRPFVSAEVLASPYLLLILVVVLQVSIVFLAEIRGIADQVLRTYTGERLTLGLRSRLFGHVQRLSLLFHDMRGTADSTYRVQYDAVALQNFALQGVIPGVAAIFMLASMIFVIAQISPDLALIALTVCPFLFLAVKFYKSRMKARYVEVKKLESSALKVIQEVLSSVRVVKTFGREDFEQDRFVETSRDGVHARLRITVAEGVLGMVIRLTVALGTAAVLFVGVRAVQSGAMSLGDLLIVIAYLTQLYGPIQTLSRLVPKLQSQLVGAHRVFEVLDEVPDVVERPGARPLGHAKGAIEFRDIAFGYEPLTPVLRDVDFAIVPGERIGIVGPTGAGKTTLVNLMTRLYDPRSGTIRLDGRDIRDYRLADLRNQFTVVLQEPVLFSTSIAENIGYATTGARQSEIIAAAEAAKAHDFILDLSDGYETLVGERGMRLSGGERQRISLARAFLKNAPILVLDEPTSSVDIATEAGIMETLSELMKGRTTFMIAHRLSTIEHCDRVLEVCDGRVRWVEPGEGLASPTDPPVPETAQVFRTDPA